MKTKSNFLNNLEKRVTDAGIPLDRRDTQMRLVNSSVEFIGAIGQYHRMDIPECRFVGTTEPFSTAPLWGMLEELTATGDLIEIEMITVNPERPSLLFRTTDGMFLSINLPMEEISA